MCLTTTDISCEQRGTTPVTEPQPWRPRADVQYGLDGMGRHGSHLHLVDRSEASNGRPVDVRAELINPWEVRICYWSCYLQIDVMWITGGWPEVSVNPALVLLAMGAPMAMHAQADSSRTTWGSAYQPEVGCLLARSLSPLPGTGQWTTADASALT